MVAFTATLPHAKIGNMEKSEIERVAYAVGAQTLQLANPQATDWLMNFLSAFGDKCRNEAIDECIGICDAYGMPDGTSETAIILAQAMKGKKVNEATP